MKPNVLTIPSGAPFAATLARGLIARMGAEPLALAQVTIYLPTRRAVRNLSETFARAMGGAALLPDIRPLGDVDEDEFLFDAAAEDLTLTPAIAPIRGRLLLATLIRHWDGAKRGGRLTFAQATALARGLANFLDEVETQGADLSKLDDLAPAALAEHWAEVKRFLELLRDQWPALLKAESAINPAARRNQALKALAKRFETSPPKGPVIAAGSTGSIPATADLLGVIARLPQGSLVLPGLDRALDAESWDGLEEGHPQYGMKELLRCIGVDREEVKNWDVSGNPTRETLLREVLRPAPTTDAWRAIADRGGGDIAKGLEDLSLIEAAHPGEEATTIALILREALETPGRTAALVTPDRNLARRVSAEMGRWKIAIDDSAGRPLAHTPPGNFLCLLIDAADSDFAPVPLLALLKHPLAAGGGAPAEFRAHARALDLALRGPRPDPGLAGLKRAISKQRELAKWFAGVAKILAPLAKAMRGREVSLADLAACHLDAAEKLAATDAEPGAARLWHGEAGEAANKLFLELAQAAADLPDVEPGSYPVLFRALAEERAVRRPYGRHPRLAILGPLEARLQSFDVVVLGGLNEGTWPASAATDPWLSRPMRKALGLEAPERAIGLSAHDFAVLAASPRVLLTRALKAEGSPTVASRWVLRLKQLTKGLGLDAKLASPVAYERIAAELSRPAPLPRMKRPAPKPDVALRPRNLSVTEVETWLRDPYAIYAKHVLKLSPLDPLDAEIGPLERGTAVHSALERFLKEFPDRLPRDAELRLIAIGNEVFEEAGIPGAALALWRPRFLNAARWFVEEERKRRRNITRSFVEIRGSRIFKGEAGDFVLRARADRIDVLTSGGGSIVDYKTGNPPNNKQVRALIAPQLPLEGAILAQGGFADVGPLAASELVYIRVGGGAEPGDVIPIKGDIAELVRDAEARLIARIAWFDQKSTPYTPRVMPYRADQPGDYDHLARVREWSLTGWEEAE